MTLFCQNTQTVFASDILFRLLQEKLDQPVSEPASPRKTADDINVDDLSLNVNVLRDEVKKLRFQLANAQAERML